MHLWFIIIRLFLDFKCPFLMMALMMTIMRCLLTGLVQLELSPFPLQRMPLEQQMLLPNELVSGLRFKLRLRQVLMLLPLLPASPLKAQVLEIPLLLWHIQEFQKLTSGWSCVKGGSAV
jgi:hypothetical protein